MEAFVDATAPGNGSGSIPMAQRVKWLQQVSDFFMADASATASKSAKYYFNPTHYLATVS